MSYLGDIGLGDTIDTKFTTVSTAGVPTALAGTPVISAYVDNNDVQLTAGITLTASFDSTTGLNHVRVVATSGNGYAAGTNIQLVITTGTVGGASVVGYVVAEFSIEKRSALRPTVAGRTVDISAGGEAGVDWANVGSPTTVLNLSGTTVKTATDVETDTVNIQGRLPAALTGGRMASNAEVVGDKTGYALSTAGYAAAADKLLGRLIVGGADGGRTVTSALQAIRNKVTLSGGTFTVFGEDDSTTSWTATYTTASRDPLSGVDPA
jgi:hypothetical protein